MQFGHYSSRRSHASLLFFVSVITIVAIIILIIHELIADVLIILILYVCLVLGLNIILDDTVIFRLGCVSHLASKHADQLDDSQSLKQPPHCCAYAFPCHD